MSKEHLQSEVNRIISNTSWSYPLNYAMSACMIIANFKGENIKMFDMTKGSALCDFNIVASAQNPTQARAMADEIARQFRALGTEIKSYEGYGSADWILVDIGDLIVHIFQENTRDAYDLDHVFGERPQVKIPEEFYFAGPAKTTTEETLKGYF